MVKRELVRISACAAVGLLVGIILAIGNDVWYLAFWGLFYGIGTFYGIKLILTALGGIGKTAGKSVFTSIAVGHWLGLFMILMLFLIAAGIVLIFGWIIGIFIAGKTLFDAYRTDSEISGSSSSSYDSGWDSEGRSSDRKGKKGKKTSNDDYDNMSW